MLFGVTQRGARSERPKVRTRPTLWLAWYPCPGRDPGPVASHLITVEREHGEIVCGRCRLADRPWTRLRGLLGRRGLNRNEGLLLRPVGAIHTLFMLFAIDVVFLDRDYVVLKVVENLRPWRFAAARKAKAVLELPPGGARRLRTGEQLVIVPNWHSERKAA